MKYGIREICEVVLKAKSRMKVGNKIFYKDEPVIYFDSLKTSTMEGAATTVYAQGGRGNSRLVAWEGERTVTFTMEDALISSLGLAILTGADVIDASEKTVVQHMTEQLVVGANGEIDLSHVPYTKDDGNYIYVMKLDNNGNVESEPYLYVEKAGKTIALKGAGYAADEKKPAKDDVVLVDYYTARTTGAHQIEITPDKFGGNFYLEASTLFRDTNGVDMPAEFIIPNCKVQSNFTFTMASSGDPSTFTFTMDAFPDYTRFDKTKKVLSVIQVIEESDDNDEGFRIRTDASESVAPTNLYIAGDTSAAAGESVRLAVAVEPFGADSAVEWKVASGDAKVTNSGVVSIAEDATGSVVITANAKSKDTVTASHTITIETSEE